MRRWRESSGDGVESGSAGAILALLHSLSRIAAGRFYRPPPEVVMRDGEGSGGVRDLSMWAGMEILGTIPGASRRKLG